MMVNIVLENPRKGLKQEILVAFIGSFILALTVGGFVYFAHTKATAIRNAKIEAQRLATQTEILSQLTEEKKEVQDRIVELQNLLPSEERLLTFDRDLKQVAQAEGIKFGFQLRGKTTGSPSNPGTLAFNLSLSGAEENIYNYLERIKNLQYVIGFKTIEVRGGGENKTIDLTGVVYIR